MIDDDARRVTRALVALGVRPPTLLPLLARTMHSSAQLPVLLSMLILSGFEVLSEG